MEWLIAKSSKQIQFNTHKTHFPKVIFINWILYYYCKLNWYQHLWSMNLQHHLISARCRPDVNETSKVRIYNIFFPFLLFWFWWNAITLHKNPGYVLQQRGSRFIILTKGIKSKLLLTQNSSRDRIAYTFQFWHLCLWDMLVRWSKCWPHLECSRWGPWTQSPLRR